MLKLGAAKKDAGRAWFLVEVDVPHTDEKLAAHGLTYRLRRKKLRQVFRRGGRYLLRSNMTGRRPAALWRHYTCSSRKSNKAFKELKHNLAIRPIFHQLEQRIEAHIFVSFIAYCLLVTLKNLARPQAPGLTPRAIVEKFAAIQMVDLHVPTADGRHLVLARHDPGRARTTNYSCVSSTWHCRSSPRRSCCLEASSGGLPVAPCSADLWGSDHGKSIGYHLSIGRVGEVGARNGPRELDRR